MILDFEMQSRNILGRHGIQFIDGQFVPVEMIDAREARFLPPSAGGRGTQAIINARVETVAGKPAFRHAFTNRRCLVLADSFVEAARSTP